MAKQRNGFCCERNNGYDLVGFLEQGHWHSWTTSKACSDYCRPEKPEQIVPCVTYIGPDAPQWRERPTCTGKYINRWSEIHNITRSILDLWDDLDGYQLAGPWFGPIPAIPENEE